MSTNDTDINALVERVRQGDDSAFDEVLAKYEGLCRNMVEKFAYDGMTREDREDLLQETGILLFKAAKTYDRDLGLTFGLYAQICLRNGLITILRKRARDLDRSADELDPNELTMPDPTSEVDESDSAEFLLGKVKKLLSESELEVLMLKLAELDRSEIAERLGIPLKSVDNTIYRIRVKLKNVLS